MSLSKINPKNTEAWKMLIKKREEIAGIQIIDLFDSSKNRIERFSIEFDKMFLDFSKNIINDETFELLLKLCEDCELKKNIKSLFNGEKINETENRSVLHTALRDFNLNSEIGKELLLDRQKIEKFTNDILSGKTRGSTNKKITDIVNVGIGGSDLGPNMVVESLKFYKTELNCHFVSNVDGDHLSEILKVIDPETTVFIIVSKTFTTQETLTNAKKIKEFLIHRSIEDLSKHFIGVTSNIKSAIEFGLDKIKNLRGVEFTWNDGGREGQRDIGIIAQEIEKVIPEVVREKEMPLMDKSGKKYKTIDYDKITAVLIEAVKEQQEQIDELKKQVKELRDGSSK